MRWYLRSEKRASSSTSRFSGARPSKAERSRRRASAPSSSSSAEGSSAAGSGSSSKRGSSAGLPRKWSATALRAEAQSQGAKGAPSR